MDKSMVINAKQRLQADKFRAQQGGEHGMNGFHYKGGQFLPNTMAEPGKWKVNKKWITSGRELIAPGEFGFQPTPFSRSIFDMVRFLCIHEGGKLKMREGVRDNHGHPLTPESTFRPGVKGVLGKEEIPYGALIDAWNNGQRWFDVAPDAEVITTKE